MQRASVPASVLMIRLAQRRYANPGVPVTSRAFGAMIGEVGSCASAHARHGLNLSSLAPATNSYRRLQRLTPKLARLRGPLSHQQWCSRRAGSLLLRHSLHSGLRRTIGLFQPAHSFGLPVPAFSHGLGFPPEAAAYHDGTSPLFRRCSNGAFDACHDARDKVPRGWCVAVPTAVGFGNIYRLSAVRCAFSLAATYRVPQADGTKAQCAMQGCKNTDNKQYGTTKCNCRTTCGMMMSCSVDANSTDIHTRPCPKPLSANST